MSLNRTTRTSRGPLLALSVVSALLISLPTASALAAPATQAGETPATQTATLPRGDLDESTFREGLRQRGLNDWLEQYLADTPAVSPVDEQLRHREALLTRASNPGTTRRQRQLLVVEASQILSKLIADNPDHPARLAWRLELARDRLEREDPTAFDAVLLYELSGRDRAAAAKLSAEAVGTLRTLREEVAGAWKKYESLDERQMAKAAEAGATRSLEQLDGQSAFLAVWADFYQIISADMPVVDRTVKLNGLLEAITERYGWTTAVPGREIQRCSALAMVTVALRLTRQYSEADRAARQISEIISTLKTPAARQGLNRTVLLAVLEQVRGPRDAGRLDEARAILDEARKWAATAQSGDIQAELALALLDRSILARQLAARSPQTAPAMPANPPLANALPGAPAVSPTPTTTSAPAAPPNLLEPAEALLPLQRVTAISPAARDAVYEALAGAIGQEPLTERRSPFELQLAAGASIADAMATAAATSTQPARDGRGLEIAAALADMLAHPPAPIPADTRGELLFLQARANYLGGSPLEAVRVLGDLVERHPDHDRAAVAAQQAAAIAQEAIRSQDAHDSAAARAAFVRAGRVLRKQSPDSPAAKQLQFFIAAALDEGHQYEEAADEYATVPADDSHALRAAWARARCLRDALNAVVATRPADDATAKTLAPRALAAARAAAEKAQAAAQSDACLAADITLVLAGLLNHPSVAQYEEAVKALEGFESRHAGCPAAVAPALRERMTALRQLKRMREAGEAIEQYLAADPENAGPLMARLLDAMRDEIHAAANRGDMTTEKATADEAAKLAERLLAWGEAHPKRLSPAEALTVSVWRAWALLEAGQAKDASDIYEQAEKAGPDALPADSALRVEIRLGKAECLLAADQATEALPIFSEVFGQVPEQSEDWWRAYVGTLGCHTKLKHDPEQIVQSIRQQRVLFPELGGPRWARELKRIEDENGAQSKPAK